MAKPLLDDRLPPTGLHRHLLSGIPAAILLEALRQLVPMLEQSWW